MHAPPFPVQLELPDWELLWLHLEVADADEEARAALREHVEEEARRRYALKSLAQHPTVAAARRAFKAVGCDPTRYRPSSEALLRRILKGDAIPAIHPLVDFGNALSAALAVPCCAMAEGSFTPPLVLRAGAAGEAYDSLRGTVFRLEGKPLLLDSEGPCDAPITGSQRCGVHPDTHRCWLTAYLPVGGVTQAEAVTVARALATRAPIVKILAEGANLQGEEGP
jgi:DNA/RNA-binding domain of Phe-tRNA-synthetase-like protein